MAYAYDNVSFTKNKCSMNKVQDWDIVVYRDRKNKYCLKNLPI